MRMHLSSAIKHWALYCGNRIAIESDYTITYCELDNASEFICKKIMLRPDPTPRVGISVRNKALLIASIIGCSRADRSFVLIDPNNSGIYLEVVEKEYKKIPIITDKMIPSYPDSLQLLIDQKAFRYEDFVHQQYNVFPETEACIIFSSGTTGTPKGIVRSNFSLLSEGILWIIELGITQTTRVMVTRPIFWTGGFIFMYATLFCGGELILSDQDDEFELLSRSIEKPVSITFIVPSQILNLIKKPIRSAKKFTKFAITMGSPISPEAKKAFSEFYECSLIEAWGNSEGLGTITDINDLNIRPNSIGRPCFCDSMEVVDKNGTICQPSEQGFLAGQSDNQYARYLQDSGTIIDTKNLRTIVSEDIGFKDSSGYFYLLGRESEKMVVGDNAIFPSHIEKIALGNNKINDAVVVLDDYQNSEPKLCLIAVIEDGDDLEVLRDWINDRLPKSHKIHKIISVELIPRNQGGKIDRDQVHKIYNKLK